MKHRFLLHSLSHTVLVVDITPIGLPTEVCLKPQMVTALRFTNWKEAEQYFRASGADDEMLEKTFVQFKKTGLSVLTIT